MYQPARDDPALQLIRDGARKGVFAGAILCGSREGFVRYHHAAGHSTMTPVPLELSASALVDVASLTKPVATTTAVMLLVDSGDLDLDDPACRYLPILKKYGKERVTIRQLLNHSSGLPAWAALYNEILSGRRNGEGPAPGAESLSYVITRISQTSPVAAPGHRSLYSDLGFILLGAIVERLAETPLDRLCKEHVFDPLGMNSTFFINLTDEEGRRDLLRGRQVMATEECPWRGRLIVGEVDDENAHAMGGIAGHAGLFSTASDIHRFGSTMLACSRGESSFLPAPLVREFWRPQGNAQDSDGPSTWALGWDTPSEANSQAGRLFSRNGIGHLGYTGCSLWIDRDSAIVVVLLSNRIHPARGNDEIRRFRPLLHDTVYGVISRPIPLPPPSARLGPAPTRLVLGPPQLRPPVLTDSESLTITAKAVTDDGSGDRVPPSAPTADPKQPPDRPPGKGREAPAPTSQPTEGDPSPDGSAPPQGPDSGSASSSEAEARDGAPSKAEEMEKPDRMGSKPAANGDE